ncbi:GntR family transcriptional regulator [Variovorax sp. J31P207]|uniref:GntR family transcriptional regulator n=1 Tax=Variovorax sp. J31P207 TaxID=3053510 RepID=UPI002577A1A5|nr:GntR family transcriptional regulator [Variovorax sp. J31P207]MDM0066249.1 GntR family transcriptional regulator [Variovorax sp. J31P207]
MNATLEPAPQKANFANIARHLTEAISSGHFSVGALLPTELELCKHYGTSRHTVRAALAELQQLGLVSRRKNVGTRVISAKPRAGFRPSLASVDDLVQFGEEHLRVVQSIAPETVSGDLAKELGCGEGSAWLRISTLRMVGDETAMPIGWTDVYIDPSYAEIGDLVQASPDALISSLIAERYDRQIAEIRQDIRAFAITDGAMARKLQVEVGASALKILRQYFDAEGEVFEISVSVHPADRFSVSMRLTR